MSDLAKLKTGLQQTGLQFRPAGNGYWQIPMIHDIASYVLHLKVEGGWVSYAADLMAVDPRADLNSKQLFSEYALSLTSEINCGAVAIDQGRFILIRNEQGYRFPPNVSYAVALKKDIDLFNATHGYVLERLLRKAVQLKLKLNRL